MAAKLNKKNTKERYYVDAEILYPNRDLLALYGRHTPTSFDGKAFPCGPELTYRASPAEDRICPPPHFDF